MNRKIASRRRLWRVVRLLGVAAAAWAVPSGAAPRAEPPPHSPAETRFLRALDQAEQGHFEAARARLAALLTERPHFRLAELVYAELTAARAGREHAPHLDADLRRRRAALLAQARVRWGARDEPATGRVPAAVVRLAPEYRHIVVADLSRNRVYLFANDHGRLRRVARFYATIGQNGFDKTTAGDRRTPVGIYHITHFIADADLPELYGIGALPLNYPNALDRVLGRTGSGIWLHGVPRRDYARAPRDSDGCVVLANEDFHTLHRLIRPGVTPVILAASLQWVKPTIRRRDAASIQRLLTAWRQGLTAANPNARRVLYRPGARVPARREGSAPRIDQLSIFRYPGTPKRLRLSFDAVTGTGAHARRERHIQYWRKNRVGYWQIALDTGRGRRRLLTANRP